MERRLLLAIAIVEAERRGSKIKKRLEIDPVEAELVHLIFRLYIEGDGRSGPLGVKELQIGSMTMAIERVEAPRSASVQCIAFYKFLLCDWQMALWGRNSKTGTLHDPVNIVEIEIPPIIPVELFERVKARLTQNNPKLTPPRVVNGPTLLTGLAVCASCGAGMTRTGTNRRHHSYSYYSCAGHLQKGKSVCKGRHIPMAKLDSLVVNNVKERLLTPKRLTNILQALIERQGAKDLAVQGRRSALEAEVAIKNDKLKRLYLAIENGIVELDNELKERVRSLKTERDIAQTSLDRIAIQGRAGAAINLDRLNAFSSLMCEKLDTGDTQARKSYLRSVISHVEVDDDKIRIIGDKATLAAVIAGRQTQATNVRGFVRNWRARRDFELLTPRFVGGHVSLRDLAICANQPLRQSMNLNELYRFCKPKRTGMRQHAWQSVAASLRWHADHEG